MAIRDPCCHLRRRSPRLCAVSVVLVATSAALAERFRAFGLESASRAPLYATLAAAAADDDAALALLQTAPEMQQMPVLFFAAVHHLLLAGEGAELARHYPNLSPDVDVDGRDPVPAFRAFVRSHAAPLQSLIVERSTQTNEIGRCALFLPPMAVVESERGPLAHIDIGASAGLTLLLPQFTYAYEPGGTVTGPSGIELRCGVRGARPLPSTMPSIVRSIGLDRSPIDTTDDDAVRWLEACVWPDQADRFDRLVRAIELARRNPPEVRRGDAVDDVATLVTEAASFGHPVITTSWVLSYLTTDQRHAFVEQLDTIGADIDLSWVIGEAPALTPGLPVPTTEEPEHLTVLSLVRWRDGVRHVERLATAHPHGYWVHWEP